MLKRLAFSLFFLAGCGERLVVKVTVDADDAILQNQEIFELRVIIDNDGDSAVETIDNKGKAIEFPVDFTTRIDAKRFGNLRIGVAGLDGQSRPVIGGFAADEIDTGAELQEIGVTMDNNDPCVAGDAVDRGCSSNFLDDDLNGFTDCDEKASTLAFGEDICAGSACGDNETNPLAGEECDDGNTQAGDGCDQNCVSEEKQFSGLFELGQLSDIEFNANASVVTNNAFQVQEGFVVRTEIDDCVRLDIQLPAVAAPFNADFFFADYGTFRVLDGAGAQLLGLNFPFGDPVVKPINALFSDNQQITVQLQGGANFDIASPKVFFDGPFPSFLPVDFNEANRTMFRDQEYTVTWTPTGSGEDAVIVLFSATLGQPTQIICQVPEDDGQVTIPKEFTRSFTRGPP